MTLLGSEPAPADFDSEEHQGQLTELYRDFAAAGMTPLWLTREGLMPAAPQPRAVPRVWRWAELHPLAARSAALVPVGRGGERRAIGLGNPGLPGDPFATLRCGRPSSTSLPGRAPRSTGTRSRRSASCSRARGSGR